MSALLLALFLALAAPLQTGDPAADLWAVGRRAEALEAWQTQLAERPGDAELRLRLGRAQLSVHHYAAALETLQPLGSEVDGERGLALYRLGRWEQALERLDPDDARQLVMRIEALEALARFEESARAIERAAQLLGEDDAQVLRYRARALGRADRAAEAVVLYERALELDPWDSVALFGLGQALVDSGRREEGLARLAEHRVLAQRLDALDFAQRGLDLAPLSAANHALLGDAERGLGRSERAQAAYRRGLELAQEAELVPIALRLARLLVEDRDDLEAALDLLETTGQRSSDARPWVRAGDLLQEAGRSMDAVQRYYKARELRPDDAAIEARIEAARRGYRKDPGQ